MIHPGLVSVTFRKLSPPEIIDLATKASLEAIEWGGDIHVPPTDADAARRVGQMTRDAGLAVAAYGSYYRVSHEPETADAVLRTAHAVGAPIVRIWAGRLGSQKADPAYRKTVIEDSRRVAAMARDLNLTLAYEFHGGTLTDTHESARRLLEEVDRPNMKTYWQPPVGATPESCLAGLDAISPWLCNVHVFHWLAEPKTRLPLVQGVPLWHQYFAKIRTVARDLNALLEFVADDSLEAFAEDARTLKTLLQE